MTEGGGRDGSDDIGGINNGGNGEGYGDGCES